MLSSFASVGLLMDQETKDWTIQGWHVPCLGFNRVIWTKGLDYMVTLVTDRLCWITDILVTWVAMKYC